MVKDLSEVLLGYRQREIAEYVCLDVCSCTPNESIRRCSLGEMVTFSVLLYMFTTFSWLSEDDGKFGNVFWGGKWRVDEHLLYSVTWIWLTHFTLTSISIWTRAAQTNAMAANSMPTVILFKGLEIHTTHSNQQHSHCSYAKRSIISYYILSHTWNWGHTFGWEGKLTGP